MGEMMIPNDADIAGLLTGYYQEVAMEATFRSQLLADTSHIVGTRVRRRRRKLIFALATAATVAVVSFLIWHFAGSPHVTIPESSLIAGSPDQAVAPSPVPEGPRPSLNAVANAPRQSDEDGGNAAADYTPGAVQVAPEPSGDAPFLTVVAARQPASMDTSELEVGDRLGLGAVVRTSSGGRVTLVTKEGSEVTLNENSHVTITSLHGLRLLDGEVYCRSRATEIQQIATAAGTIELLGTALDAALEDSQSVAVTVIHGKVRLANSHGEAIVDAGRKSVLTASLPPGSGAPVDIRAATAWYDGRGTVLSDFGDIAYTIRRGGMFTEIWTMKADGAGKRHVKSYLGHGVAPGTWLPGEEWLLFDTHSLLWTTPNFETRRADAGAGHPIVEGRAWLLNAATGEDIPFALPAGYDPLYMTISPDAQRLAFSGRYQPDPKSREGMEGGVFVFDVATGDVKRVLEGWIKTAPAWAPDSRRLVASTGEGYGTNYPLVVVDVDTGEVTDLEVQGAAAAFSPEGTRIAYCGGFSSSGSWSAGVPTSGSIWVLSLEPGSKPVRISPDGEGALQPHWSPDGRQVLYVVRTGKTTNPGEERVHPGYTLYAADADGSGGLEMFRKEPSPQRSLLRAASWSPSGEVIYLSTDQGVMLVAADGSGEVVDVGGNETDSVLTPEEQEVTDAAVLAVREAIFQYAVGQVRAYEGKPRDSTAACSAASNIFAGLPYEYPVVKFSIDDVLDYADKSADLASRRASEILDKSCEERQSYLSILLMQYVAAKTTFPPDLVALEKHSLGSQWGINWISNRDAEWVKMVFRCPADGAYPYTPPATGENPEVGDVLLSCPVHQTNRLVWTEEMAQELAWRRASAARQAVEEDPRLKALVDEAEMVRQKVSHTGVPWEEAEQAYLKVLAAIPYEPTAREHLGRIYTRWGEFDKALTYLSPPRGGWSSLYYAFCKDALGQRDEALAVYSQYAEGNPSWVGTQWAKLGLEKPTWPRDLSISAEPGEVRIKPDSHWHATATATVIPDAPHLTGNPALAIDDNRETSWQTSGEDAAQTPGEWFKLEFDSRMAVTRVVLDHYGERSIYTNNWARGIRAEISLDGMTWGEVDISQGAILEPSTVRLNPDEPIKAIKFTTTATHDPEWWGIYEVFVFGPVLTLE